jgi:hypothetical protein
MLAVTGRTSAEAVDGAAILSSRNEITHFSCSTRGSVTCEYVT